MGGTATAFASRCACGKRIAGMGSDALVEVVLHRA
jgi:hypothetical protein